MHLRYWPVVLATAASVHARVIPTGSKPVIAGFYESNTKTLGQILARNKINPIEVEISNIYTKATRPDDVYRELLRLIFKQQDDDTRADYYNAAVLKPQRGQSKNAPA